MIQKILNMLLPLFGNIKDLIITGICFFTEYGLELLTVVVIFLFAALIGIGIAIALETKND